MKTKINLYVVATIIFLTVFIGYYGSYEFLRNQNKGINLEKIDS